MNIKTIEIGRLIKELTALKEAGAAAVQVIGTIYCAEAGNKIVVSTEPQM